MKVRYLYSACIEIINDDVKILTDPWFTEGIFDGSWCQYPKIKDPLNVITDPDIIYISHIHPDHYDPEFLSSLFEEFGTKKVIIPDFENNYLFIKAKIDGINVTPTKEMTVGDTTIAIFPNLSGSISDIDSALLVYDKDHAVLNLNDCTWNDTHIKTIQTYLVEHNISLDFLALGFTGAGPYPQTYYDIDKNKDILLAEGLKKKHAFFERYKRNCAAFPAKYHLPFAGKYYLGGKLHRLNQYRGVSDPVEVTKFDPKAVILADGGHGTIDLTSGHITAIRSELYTKNELEKFTATIANLPMDYENDYSIPIEKISFVRLMNAAYEKSIVKSEIDHDYFFIVHVMDSTDDTFISFILNANKNNRSISKWKDANYPQEDYSEILIDYRYLYGLLTGVYHWNNAEVGSQYLTRRRLGTEFNRSAQRFLYFFSAC